MFLEASGNGNNLEQPVIHENAAHFVPPPIAMELPPPLPGPTSVEVPPPLPGNYHSLIRGVLIQSCSAEAKNFTNYVFCHVQFNSPGQNSKNHCGIKAKISKFDF